MPRMVRITATNVSTFYSNVPSCIKETARLTRLLFFPAFTAVIRAAKMLITRILNIY